MIDLGQLEAFVQVAEHASFSRAGEALMLTQPTISARIQTLERDVGEQLFERSGRAVRVTEAGNALLPYARKVLETYRAGIGAIDELRAAAGGRLRLGSARVIGTYVLPTLLDRFRDQHPGVRLSIRTGRSADVLAAVLANEVELGFTRNLIHPDIEAIHLFDEPLVLAVSPHHPLAKELSAPISALIREPLILYHRDSTYYNLIVGACRDAGVLPEVVMELDNIEATKRMITRNLGVSILPASSLEDEVRYGALASVPIENANGLRLPAYAIHQRRGSIGYLVEAFLKVAREVYPEPVRA